MFYAFEVVLGAYSKRMLAPVGVAAVLAVLTAWVLAGSGKAFDVIPAQDGSWTDYPLALLIGSVCAIVGIAVMLLVSGVNRVLKQLHADATMGRILAAVVLTLVAIRFPAVLGSGHAAIEHAANGEITGHDALRLLAGKWLASAVSLGSGFRGGLFSASLMMGALTGQVVAWALAQFPSLPPADPVICALIGMASLGASIIGSPLSMTFLVLETTGDFGATLLVAIGAVSASFLTDRLFGYSFATWRFQERGLAIDGGHDVSRLAAATIDELVRPPKRKLPVNASYDEVVRALSAAGAKGAAVYGPDGSFVGLVDPRLVEVLGEETSTLPIVAAELVYDVGPVVTPRTTLAELLDVFRDDDRPTLAVVDAGDSRALIGCVRARDAFALASSVLDAQRREELGMSR
jgi:CIC family chloride channel protein